MRYVAIFDDAPEMLAVRREREALHIEYLRTHSSEIRRIQVRTATRFNEA